VQPSLSSNGIWDFSKPVANSLSLCLKANPSNVSGVEGPMLMKASIYQLAPAGMEVRE
jgi:hypothetical protein